MLNALAMHYRNDPPPNHVTMLLQKRLRRHPAPGGSKKD
jgi:hypothetical protein